MVGGITEIQKIYNKKKESYEHNNGNLWRITREGSDI